MTTQKRIMVIDGDFEAQKTFTEALSENFQLIITTDGRLGYELATRVLPDMILLELTTPILDGLEVCTLLKGNAKTRNIPILIVTCSNDFERHLMALEKGADHVLMKPFDGRELRARIFSKLRAGYEVRPPSAVFRSGDLELNYDNFECRVGGKIVFLSVLDFNLLRFFAQNMDCVLSREKIIEHVWKGAIVSARNIDTRVSLLRKALKKSGLDIFTRYGAGYALKMRHEQRRDPGNGYLPLNPSPSS